MKKTKKPKEKGEEEATKETDEKEKDKPDNETEATKKEQHDGEAAKESEEEDSSYRTPHVVNMPSGEQKPLIRQDTVANRRVPDTSAIPQEQGSSRSAKNEERTPEKDKAKGCKIYFFYFVEFLLVIVKLFYNVSSEKLVIHQRNSLVDLSMC